MKASALAGAAFGATIVLVAAALTDQRPSVLDEIARDFDDAEEMPDDPYGGRWLDMIQRAERLLSACMDLHGSRGSC